LRHPIVKSVLSSGLALRAAAVAAAVIDSSVSGWPISTFAASSLSIGQDPTAPTTIRAARTNPFGSRSTHAATPNTGKSKAPRRLNFW